ncbi:hypothetical protein ACHAWT_001870 [Skeletonema menzelii]
MPSSWQVSLAQLAGLIVVLPFSVTYLHLYYYTFISNEYCFVGQHTSLISGKNYNTDTSDSILDSTAAANNEIISNNSDSSQHDVSQLFGIYTPQQNQKRSKSKKNDRRQFHQTYAASTTATSSSSRWGWPSITQISDMVSSPTSQLSHKSGLTKTLHQPVGGNSITFVETKETRRWCIGSTSLGDGSAQWCSPDFTNEPDKKTIYLYPPSGVYTKQQSSVVSSLPNTIYITCPAPTVQTQPPPKKTRHNEQLFRENKNIRFIARHPATVLLLLLNIGLAFHYWNQRVNPALVCKQYSLIVDNHEWWRGFTGATAHFEPLHIGFNMMSLHTLGRELEGEFGSVNFFLYNVALVVMTTIVMMGMVYGRIRWHQRQNSNGSQDSKILQLRETSSVGYSGVLFAWMVISTLEREQATCPIPFFNDVCFSTYSFGQLKFNIAPVVSLFVAQFIMPRVSFMGHLAGIICGFGLHWGWPPIELGSANVLIGGVFLFGNLFWRKGVVPVVPLTPPDGNDHDDDNQLLSLLLESGQDGIDGILMSLPGSGDVEAGNNSLDRDESLSTVDPFTRSKEKKKEREMAEMRRKHKTVESIRNLIGLVTVLSFLFFDWMSSIVLSQCLLLAFFIFGTRSSFIVWACTQAKVENEIITPEKQRCGMIWRGFVMSCVLAIVVDGMSMAGWILLQTFISSEKTKLLFGLVPSLLFMLLRVASNILGMVIASKVLHDMGQVSYSSGGIFVSVFSRVLTCSKAIGDGVFLSQRPLWTAFEGRGIRLGGGELLARISRSPRSS